jgi:hypothetical protein
MSNPRNVSAEQLALDFETYGAVVKTYTLTIEPAYDDQGTTVAQAKLMLGVHLNRMKDDAVATIERVTRARVRMEQLP